MKYQWQKFT